MLQISTLGGLLKRHKDLWWCQASEWQAERGCRELQRCGRHSEEYSEKLPKDLWFCDLVLNHMVLTCYYGFAWTTLTDISRGSSSWESMCRHQPFTRGHRFLHQVTTQCIWWLTALFNPQRRGQKSSPFLQRLHLSSILQAPAFKDKNHLRRALFGSLPLQCAFPKKGMKWFYMDHKDEK